MRLRNCLIVIIPRFKASLHDTVVCVRRFGDEQTIENTILSYEPMGMLSIKVNRTPDGFPFPNAIKNMWTNMYFEPAGPDQTRIRIVGPGFTSDEESQRMRVFFDEGNSITLKQLQEHFAGALN